MTPSSLSPLAVELGLEHSEKLLEVVTHLSFCRELPRVMAVVREAARELSGADGVTFVLREGELCHYADESAIAPLWKGHRFPMTACISGWVMLNGRAVAIENIYEDPRIPADAYRPTFVKSLAMVPVRREAPVAAIGAYWATHHLATAREMALLQWIADAASLALENVRLYGDLAQALAHERAAREQAEGASRLKDEFLTTLSHELRTPLNAILGWVRLLRSGAVRDPQHALEVIERNAEAQFRLVSEILDLRALARGDMALQVQPLNPADVVEAVLESMAPALAAKRLALTRRIDGSLALVADPARLQQIVWNLLTNAAKFTREGGHIEVTLARADGMARLVVADTGIGIPAHFLPHVFERFRQADMTSSRTHGGLGIGLALVRHLVELHGGTVSVTSDGADRGATFTVEIPLPR